ncbi:15135_t:CDS:2 [Rhizophagus irregularis]|nr:15135_t:CDS:2 [Rhizophagus irregularis]
MAFGEMSRYQRKKRGLREDFLMVQERKQEKRGEDKEATPKV